MNWSIRPGTIDMNFVATVDQDEYNVLDRKWSGWALDVGAYIGTVGIALADRNPDLRVIAIEAVPENCEIIESNIRNFRLQDRVTLLRAWAGGPNDLTGMCHYGYRGGDIEAEDYVRAHRFVGGTWGASRAPEFSVEMPAISLDAILEQFGIDDVAVMKIDCEGCEWAFLDTPAVSRVAVITGEYHGGITKVEDAKGRLSDLLEATHDIEWRMPDEPIIGLFEAVRR